jgi:hypothetical protein
MSDQSESAKRAWLMPFVVHAAWVACLFLVYLWAEKKEPADALFWSAFVSGTLGAAVTLFPKLTEPLFKGAVFAVFVAASLVGANASYRASKDSDKAAAATKTKVDGIDAIVADVHKRSEEISELNRKTLDAASRIIDVEREIRVTTGESLKNITGGSSFVYVEPLVSAALPDGRIPLRIVNNGRYPITGVVVRFHKIRNPADEKFREDLEIPPRSSPMTVPPGTSIPMTETITPSIDFEGIDVDAYALLITSSNGTIHQSLFFRKDQHPSSKMFGWWQFRTRVVRERPLVRAPGRAHVTQPPSVAALLQTEWLGATWTSDSVPAKKRP